MPIGGAPLRATGQKFVDAFNRRDAAALVGLCAPEVELHPSILVGDRRVYRGHEGLRRWVADLRSATIQHQARVREVRALDERRFVILSEVLVEDELLSSSAMVGRVDDEGRVVEARAYLSDEELLTQLGMVAGKTEGDGRGKSRSAPPLRLAEPEPEGPPGVEPGATLAPAPGRRLGTAAD